jgi:hypothetical protein
MMISNPKGWRNKRAAALVRKQEKDARAHMNAQRWRAFQGLPPLKEKKEREGELSDEQLQLEMADLANKIESSVNELAQVVSDGQVDVAVDPETMTNGDLRRAIEEKGFEVPKNTARARLIELYHEKVK